MALMRSGQKGLDEIQRIQAAMEGGNPVITEAQQGLIKRNAALLGEDGSAIRHLQTHRELLPRLEQESGESGDIERTDKGEGNGETGAGGGREGAGDQV